MGDVKRPRRLDQSVVEERRTKVSQLYLHGQTIRTIARTLDVSVGTVAGDLAAIKEEWRTEQLGNVAAVVERELMELLTIDGEAAKQFSETKAPEWLMLRLRVKERRARMLGLDAAKKTEISGPQGQPIEYRDVDRTLDSKLHRLAAALAQGAVPGGPDA